ncbi:MAG: L,D-transpeptidase [Cyanobacteria bacterium J06627_8]
MSFKSISFPIRNQPSVEGDRPRLFNAGRFDKRRVTIGAVSIGTLASWVMMAFPSSAQVGQLTAQTLQQSQHTSVRTLQSPSRTMQPQRSQLPFRVRRPQVPPLDVSPQFPEAVLPEAEYSIHLVIRLSQRRVFVYRGSSIETSYPIAIGRQGWETPTGRYEVLNMVENPEWQNPFTGDVIAAGPSNPLGERWIGFWTDGSNFIGFHGTPNEASVGTAASHGCVRMYNHHIRQLFETVALGTTVIVEP